MTKAVHPIVVEQSFSASAETVWRAITERDQMVQWFFDNIPEFRAEVGFQTEFIVDAGEREFLHRWRILEVVPGQKIVYDWRYPDYSGVGKVTFAVAAEGTGSRIRLTCEGIETFPQDIPEFSPEACQGGWDYFIRENLKSYLDRKP